MLLEDLAAELVPIHERALDEWYGTPAIERIAAGDDLQSTILAEHFCNFTLWNLEDQARRRDLPDSSITAIKREIDCWNQRRNDLIERTDVLVLADLEAAPTEGAEQHSETVGMIIDRLSILSLKVRHMAVHAARADAPTRATECAGKLVTLGTQRDELTACLRALINDCRAGRRFFKLYKQHKTYNDARLNPALSGSAK
jgi:hypothetical protein